MYLLFQRFNGERVSQFDEYTDADITYNGAPAPDEDPADYIRTGPIRAEVIA